MLEWRKTSQSHRNLPWPNQPNLTPCTPPILWWHTWLASRRAILTIAALGVLYGIIVALPTPSGLSWQGQRVLGVAALAIGLWCTEVLPTGVTSMLVLLLLVLSGGVPGFREALAGFAEPVTYFLMAVLTLGLAVLRSGLAERVARFFCSAAPVVHERCICNCSCLSLS